MMNIFEKAIKQKIRFPSNRGTLSAEDLWDLTVEELDVIYKTLNASKKSLQEDSLLETKSTEDTLVNTQIKIITHVVETKLAEKQARLEAADKKEKKQKILAILDSKEDSALEKKSPAALRKMLEEL